MKFYSNRGNSNYEELLSFYPIYYYKVYEMTEILKAQGKLLDNVQNDIEQVFSNNFINNADSETLSLYENLFGLTHEKNIEERRKVVKAYLIGNGKISASIIKEVISSYTSADVKCKLEAVDDLGDNTLFILADRGFSHPLNINAIEMFLNARLPAHLNHELSVCMEFPIKISFEIETFETELPVCGSLLCGQHP